MGNSNLVTLLPGGFCHHASLSTSHSFSKASRGCLFILSAQDAHPEGSLGPALSLPPHGCQDSASWGALFSPQIALVDVSLSSRGISGSTHKTWGAVTASLCYFMSVGSAWPEHRDFLGYTLLLDSLSPPPCGLDAWRRVLLHKRPSRLPPPPC
jgi:hypothetical protein